MSMIGFGWRAEKFSKAPDKVFNTFKSKYKNKLTNRADNYPNNLKRPKKLINRYKRTKYKHFRDTVFYKVLIGVIIATIFCVAYALAIS